MKRFLKIAVFASLLTLLTVTATLFAFGAQAPKAKVERYNLSFKDSVYISYAVSFENVPDDAECGILVWKEPKSAYTVETEGYTKITEVSSRVNFGDKSCNVYDFKGLTATEMTKDVYVVAFINDGGRYTYSDLAKYSILQYVYNKLGHSGVGSPTDDAELVDLLNAMLEYGAAAQEHFGENTDKLATDKYYMLRVDGGHITDLSLGGLYKEGAKVTVTAPTLSGGLTFVGWYDDEGQLVGKSATYSYTVPAKNTELKAVYGVGTVKYVLNGGSLPTDAPVTYPAGAGLSSLPTPTRSGYVFDGWYTETPSFSSTSVTSIPPTAYGEVTLHAIWNYVDEDYTSADFIADDTGNKIHNGITYATNGKTDSTMKVLSENGNRYLEWYNGPETDSFIQKSGVKINTLLGPDKLYTVSMDFRLVDGRECPMITVRPQVATNAISLFNITASGEVRLGSSSDIVLFQLNSDTFTTVKVSFDFKTGKLYAENAAGKVVSTDAKLPSSHPTIEEFLAAADRFVSIRSGSNREGIVHIDNIKISTEEFDYSKGMTEEEREEYISRLESEIADFEYSSSHTIGSHTDFDTSKFEPEEIPDADTHPRLMLNAEALPAIRAAFMHPDNKKFADKLKNMADSHKTGILDAAYEHTSGRIGVHNYNGSVLYALEAKALMYLITGDEVYGLEAILGIKNYLNTLDIRWIYSDQCREFGSVMFVTAEIYDWCYGLLSESDKEQLMLGVEYLVCRATTEKREEYPSGTWTVSMEVGFPPEKQGTLVGHGSEAQILRDYLAAAIAFYDEDPTWYDFIAGRVYEQFIPFRNSYFEETGIYPQGSGNYANHRFRFDLYAAWMFMQMPGVGQPYSPATEQVMVSFAAYERPDGLMFPTGDGSARATGSENQLIAGAIFGNKTLYTVGLSEISVGTGASSVSAAQFMIFASKDPGRSSGEHEGIPVILYNGGFAGQIISREEWGNENAAATFMKIGERSTANHEHADSGTFQIYYKGLFSGDSGVYTAYGSEHHVYYHRATVAHNGLLLYDPDAYSAELNADGTPKSKAAYWYSGSQRFPSSEPNLDRWINSSDLEVGSVTAYRYAYKDNAESLADFAFIAGDITSAYSNTVADFVSRKMLTVYTGDESIPMIFFVYDDLKLKKNTVEARFVLHAGTEPTVNAENGTVTVVEGGGKLVLTSLLGIDRIEKLGGAGKTFLINGVNCTPANSSEGKEWGRVEIIKSAGFTESELMNVIYVTDADGTASITPKLIDGDGYAGAEAGNTVAVFFSDRIGAYDPITISTTGSGLKRYFVSGLNKGTWIVSVDGTTVTTVKSSEEDGIVEFTAASGDVTLTPASDVPKIKLIYETDGGELPISTPSFVEQGQTLTLAEPTRGEDTFLGWYLTPDFSGSAVTKIDSASYKGVITLYAKYSALILSETFDGLDFTHDLMTNATYGKVYYQFLNKLAVASTVKDSGGNTFLEIVTQKSDQYNSDPQISGASSSDAYKEAVIKSGGKLTYELDIAALADGTVGASIFRMREDGGSSSDTINIFTTSSGAVYLGGNKSYKIATVGADFTKIIITFDVVNATLTAYSESGSKLASVSVSVPAAALDPTATDTVEKWFMKASRPFQWYFSANGGMRIDNIKIYSGEYVVTD